MLDKSQYMVYICIEKDACLNEAMKNREENSFIRDLQTLWVPYGCTWFMRRVDTSCRPAFRCDPNVSDSVHVDTSAHYRLAALCSVVIHHPGLAKSGDGAESVRRGTEHSDVPTGVNCHRQIFVSTL